MGVSWGSGPLGGAARSPDIVGRFIFFRDSAWFLKQTRVLPDTDVDDDETGLPPLFFEQKIAKFYRHFFGDFKKTFQISQTRTEALKPAFEEILPSFAARNRPGQGFEARL